MRVSLRTNIFLWYLHVPTGGQTTAGSGFNTCRSHACQTDLGFPVHARTKAWTSYVTAWRMRLVQDWIQHHRWSDQSILSKHWRFLHTFDVYIEMRYNHVNKLIILYHLQDLHTYVTVSKLQDDLASVSFFLCLSASLGFHCSVIITGFLRYLCPFAPCTTLCLCCCLGLGARLSHLRLVSRGPACPQHSPWSRRKVQNPANGKMVHSEIQFWYLLPFIWYTIYSLSKVSAKEW